MSPRKKKKRPGTARRAGDRFHLPPGALARPDLPRWGSPAWHKVVGPQNFAFYRGIDTLYKFRKLSSTLDEERFRAIIEHSTVYFAPHDTLNDMYDMAIRHVITGDKANPATRRRVMRDLERLMRASDPPVPEDTIRQQLKYYQTADLAELERQATEASRARLATEYPIFCLTSDNTRPAQWAYYAADNTGVCIHFDSRLQSNSPFAYARMVEYQDARPSLPIPLTLEGTEVARRVALIKHKDWRHEREYRVLGHKDIGINFRSFDGRKAEFDPALIVGITVGGRMPKKKVELVRSIATARVPPIPVFRANTRPDTFTFSIERL
jgi:hypothetical protein